MPKKVLIILTDGFEEIETITPIDILRRADLNVIVAGLEKKEVTGSHGIKVTVDTLLKEVSEMPDAIVFPGGPGAETLGKSPLVQEWLRKTQAAQKVIGAICAAPAVVLGANGSLAGKKATCFPGYEDRLGKGSTFSEERVVRDGLIITSRGAGTAMEFALELVRSLISEAKASEISRQILAVV